MPGSFFRFIKIMLPVLLIWVFLMPASAHADGLDVSTCAVHYGATVKNWQYTSKLVYCMESLLDDAEFQIMDNLSQFMLPVVGATLALAVIFFGFRIVSGERQLLSKAVGFLIRLVLVAVFSYNLNGWAGYIFEVSNWLSTVGTGTGCPPWESIDVIIARLMGISTTGNLDAGITLNSGVLGIATGGLFSSTMGMFFFMACVTAIISLFLFIFRIVYIYILAVAIIAFMIALSPLIIPLAVFNRTERYFRVWMDKIIAAMLVPMFLFAFLSSFLGLFTDRIDHIFTTLGARNPINFTLSCGGAEGIANPDMTAFMRINQPLFSWAMKTDAAGQQAVAVQTGQTGPITSGVSSNINPLKHNDFDMNVMEFPGVDFGPNNFGIMKELMLAFINIFLLSMIMRSMLGLIPDIANGIAGTVSGVDIRQTGVESAVKKLMGASGKEVGALQGKLRDTASQIRPGNQSGASASIKSATEDFN